MNSLHDEVYIVSINNGEEEQNLYDLPTAQKLFNDLINDPADHYKNIRLIKYNFETKEETLLDSANISKDLEEILEDAGYELATAPDSLPVVEVEPDSVEVNYSQYTTLVYTLQAIANDIKYIHWNCCGQDFDQIHEITESYYSKLNEQIDLFAEIALEQPGVTLASPSKMASKIDWPCLDDTNCIGSNDAWQYIRNLIQTLITELQFNYDKFDSDIKSEIDTAVRHWKSELGYKIVRRLEDK